MKIKSIHLKASESGAKRMRFASVWSETFAGKQKKLYFDSKCFTGDVYHQVLKTEFSIEFIYFDRITDEYLSVERVKKYREINKSFL